MTIRIPPKTKQDARDSTEALRDAATGGSSFTPAENVPDSTATDIEEMVADHNALLASLRAAGLME